MTVPLQIAALSFIFFLSGAAALLFESLWFRLAGFTLGNSVWASMLVLAGYMGGLAIGNGLAGAVGSVVRRPIRLYALLEGVIAATGIGLVLIFPDLTRLLIPWSRPFLESFWSINLFRFFAAFGLMLIPTAAMGATLPLLVRALCRADSNFGSALGRLYGWNTLGAVGGALVGELVLIERFGLSGTGWAAGGLNLSAGLLAYLLARRVERHPATVDPGRADPNPVASAAAKVLRCRGLLLAGFIAGAVLLGLEIVWFRFLQLFVRSTNLTFAIMLAAVLGGIGLGGLVASRWMKRSSRSDAWAPLIALACGAATVVTYALFDPLGVYHLAAWKIALLTVLLVFPSALGSGVLFALLGQAIHRKTGSDLETTAALAAFNTTGGLLGALLAGAFLLPHLGMEGSFFLLVSCYGAVAVAARSQTEPTLGRRSRLVNPFGGLLFVAALILFPFGSMQDHLDASSRQSRRRDGSTTIAVREGLSETLQLLRTDFYGKPLYYRVMTNGFSVASSHATARRYMNLFVYWPVALHPGIERTLLISYGIGNTAKALTDTRELKSIDIVDTSREILELSGRRFPEPGSDPLEDPRVSVFVEDGRYFLLTYDRHYDLITSEPPPPNATGIISLYTKEYFQLIHDRLNEGGMVTYWLPVHSLTAPSALAILKGFCDVFSDCALWSGHEFNWMMSGSRHGTKPVSAARVRRQWEDPQILPTLEETGFEIPELLATTFIADAASLAPLLDGVAPALDDYPQRVSLELPEFPDAPDYQRYREWRSVARTRPLFESSSYIRGLLPDSLRRSALDYFWVQDLIDQPVAPDSPTRFSHLDQLLEESELKTPVYWALRSEIGMQRIIDYLTDFTPTRQLSYPAVPDRRSPPHKLYYQLGVRALAKRDFGSAAAFFRSEYRYNPDFVSDLLVYSLCKAGDPVAARELAGIGKARANRNPAYRCW